MSRTLIISPHYDDAALSAAGFVGKFGAGAPGTVTVVTVLGGEPPEPIEVSGWDALCGFTSAREAVQTRRSEDEQACGILGVDSIVLSHVDGPYGADEPLTELSSLLAELTAPNLRVLIPAGIGNRDHQRVCDTALTALEQDWPGEVWAFADLPYAAHAEGWADGIHPDDFVKDERHGGRVRELLARYDLVEVADLRLEKPQWIRKRRAILAHGSQLVPLGHFHHSFMPFPGPLQRELAWRLRKRS